jgi:hypothetical protein
MAWSAEPRCNSCSRAWPEVTQSDRDHRAVYCDRCGQFVALRRIPYTFQRFAGCPHCQADLSQQVTADSGRFPCPYCPEGTVEFHEGCHFLPCEEPEPLRQGMVVEASLDNWAIRVPDLPAIPRSHLSGTPGWRADGVYALEVIGVPVSDGGERDYFFRLVDAASG